MVSEARQSSPRLDTVRPKRPVFPKVSQARIGGQVTEEIPDVLTGAARPVGLRVDGKLRLNYATAGYRFYLAGLRPGFWLARFLGSTSVVAAQVFGL